MYSKQFEVDHPAPTGWIQFKGSDICCDIHCTCGHLGHIDADFAYHVKCPKCNQVYELDGHIKLWPIDLEPEGTITAE